jgi:O-acetyl-ADP-ribose deacetylase
VSMSTGSPAASSSTREALLLADEHGLTSIGFPAISTGVFGYPVEEAADVAIDAIRETAPSLEHVRRVRFVLFSPSDLEIHERALAASTPS